MNRPLSWLRLALISLALLITLSLTILPVAAHTEGKMQLAAESAGPYKLTVWTSPDPAEVGELHVAVSVVLAEDASPVLDADVQVQLIHASGQPALSQPASTEDSENKFLYEAIFQTDESGAYDVTVTVNGTDGAVGSAAFPLELTGGGGFNILYLIPIGLALAAVLVFFLTRRPGRDVAQVPTTD